MDARLIEIAEHYGLDAQLGILQEELAELIQAVSKFKRGDPKGLPEEIADVYIMLSQVVYLINKDTSVDLEEFIALYEEKKIRRQLERIKEEANNE